MPEVAVIILEVISVNKHFFFLPIHSQSINRVGGTTKAYVSYAFVSHHEEEDQNF